MRNDTLSWPEQGLHHLLFQESPQATVVVADEDGRVLLANRAARQLRGWDLDELFRDWRAGMAPFRARLHLETHAVHELTVQSANGRPRHLSLEGRSHGTVHAIVLVDVTDRRQVEVELAHLRRLETVGFLTASMVHDLNNVLTPIVCSAGLLESTVNGKEASELAREIVAAGARATGLVRRVMQVLRREPAKPQRVNLAVAVAKLRGLLELVAGPSIQFKLDFDPETADVVVDPERLDHLLINLATNARAAMPRGGELRIATANVKMDEIDAPPVDATAGDSYVALTISDTGQGMVPEVRERVFERFFTTKGPSEGTGLGLASAYRFVAESGGVITVRSAPGRGTTILVYLPRAPIGAFTEPPRALSKGPEGEETVLLLEGDDHVRFVAAVALRDRGYFVIDAPSGELALRMVRRAERRVDLVLADVSAPGLTGREVAKHLERERHAPALLWMSGLTDRAMAEHDLGNAPILRKAFTPGELARCVREVLDGEKSLERRV